MMGHQRIGILRVFLAFVLYFCVFFVVNGDDLGSPVQLNDDVLGLIVFKAGLLDPSSRLESWNEDDDSPCSWSYVKCNPRSGRVSEVSLDGLGLSGKIGRGLQKLQNLKVLSLSNNNFTGDLIPEIGLIKSLQSLNLSHNRLSGLIPTSLGTISSLKFLDLSGNSFSGTLPDDFFMNCSSLRYLSLAGNTLGGQLPSSLAKCSLLSNLNFSGNQFSGNPSLVSGIWLLQRLRRLDLSHNSLAGPIPLGVLALHNVKELLLQGNHFSGSLPVDIGLCPHLQRLDLSNNLLTGEVPSTFQRLNSLMFFSLSNNLFSGDFPEWISSLSSLEHLDFSNNALTGELPSSIGNLRSLKYLSLSNNKLAGEIPASLAHCNELFIIQLRGNSFTGGIPDGLFDLGLAEIDFSHNGFTGSLPRGSSRLFESLRVLNLSRNNLVGSIPGEIGLFAHLRYLNLSWNDFHTRIPPELGFLQNLTVLDLRNSALMGSVPADICESESLEILQLDGNSLNGPIPEGIGNCSSLYLLSLSHNNLSGPIPKSLSNLVQLKILKLEMNELSGEIPPELGNLENLLAVNISFNQLTGRLPVGSVFQSLDQSALKGNLGLCSPLLKGPCKMNVPKPLVIDPNAYNSQGSNGEHMPRNRTMAGSGRFHRGTFLSVSVIIAITAAILIASGVIVISLLNASVRRRLAFMDNALESIFSGSSKSGSMATGKLVLLNSRSSSSSSEEFSRNPESLLNKAAEIGEGVFGTVYKAPLGEQGSIVAIKRLNPSNILQNPEDFDREVRILAKAKHVNVAAIKGYFWTQDLQLLVSEYVSNGNLQYKLHERPHSTPPLFWATRFRIILGVAKGLAYLHHSFRPPIVHFNLKPSNILLDENNNPKVSDFGLSRLLKNERNMMNNRLQNALGYAAPELECQSLRVNEKCDVYGFGVLILELVTGRRPVEYGEDSFVILSHHVRVLLEQGNVLECIDPAMDGYSEDEVLPVLKLALVCTSHVPSNRPTMAEIVQILQVIKTPVPQRTEIL